MRVSPVPYRKWMNAQRRRTAIRIARKNGNTDPNANVGGGALLSPRNRRVPLIWYVKHRLRDQSVETFRCNTEARAHSICRDLKEAGELAWVEDEQGRLVQDLEPNR